MSNKVDLKSKIRKEKQEKQTPINAFLDQLDNSIDSNINNDCEIDNINNNDIDSKNDINNNSDINIKNDSNGNFNNDLVIDNKNNNINNIDSDNVNVNISEEKTNIKDAISNILNSEAQEKEFVGIYLDGDVHKALKELIKRSKKKKKKGLKSAFVNDILRSVLEEQGLL